MSAPLVRTIWVDKDGRRAAPVCGGIQRINLALWPWQAEPFIPAGWRRSRMIPEDSDLCPDLASMVSPEIRIVSVSDQSVLSRQPGDEGGVTLPLRAMGGQGRLHWFLNQRPLGQPGTVLMTMAMPDPGDYQLAVVDETGNYDQISFRVTRPDF